jgi:hypothetical protein
MRCECAVQGTGMAKIIPVQFRPSRLPRRLLNDGWWLETKSVRPIAIVFPARSPPTPAPARKPEHNLKCGHLTLVISGK